MSLQPIRPTCAVFAPITYLTVTIEPESERSCVHLHPGGQGFWIARMLVLLGCDARLVAPLGGEAGDVLTALLPGWEVDLTMLDRHEIDEMYGALLESCLACGSVVLTGANGVVPDDFYERLVSDITAHDVTVFADMHGSALDAALAGGPITALKVSEDDLDEDGCGRGDEAYAIDLARGLSRRGASTVVVSQAGSPAAAITDDKVFRVTPPYLTEVDHRGAGDSMTAGIVAGHLLGFVPLIALRWGAAAGANNVVRRGLGTGRAELICELVDRVEIEEVA